MSAPLTKAELTALEGTLKKYAEDFVTTNHAAKVLLRALSLVGIGLRPILDHFVFRTQDPKERIREFQDRGYVKDPAAKVFSDHKSKIEVYRCKCLPAILIEEAISPAAQAWVKAFGDESPYVMAVRVDNLEDAEIHLERQAVGFLRPSAGKPGEEIREIASIPVFQKGETVNVLVFVERHAGNMNYYAPDFWARA